MHYTISYAIIDALAFGALLTIIYSGFYFISARKQIDCTIFLGVLLGSFIGRLIAVIIF